MKDDIILCKARVLYEDGYYKDIWIKIKSKWLIDKGDFIHILGIFEPNTSIKLAKEIMKKYKKK